MSFKPLLASEYTGKYGLIYPVYASPKVDGVRALIKDGIVLSRSLKPIPNKYIQSIIGNNSFNGLDGELVVGSPTDKDVFRNTTSSVMRIKGEPDFKFFIFDDFSEPTIDYQNRLSIADHKSILMPRGELLRGIICEDEHSLRLFEEQCLNEGYEGIMVRSINGKYKFGRSTEKESILLKVKRFKDSEAEIIRVVELMTNTNEATINEVGNSSRSSKKEGLIPAGIMGSIEVKDIHTGIEFSIGTGFTHSDREDFWNNNDNILGSLVKYKYFDIGTKDAPRFPVFLGFREQIDI